MRNTLSALFLLAALLSGALLVHEGRQNRALRAELASLQSALAERDRKLDTEAARVKELKQQQITLASDVWRLNTEIATIRATSGPAPANAALAGSAPAAATGAAKAEGGFGEMLSKMMSDPAMKKMLRQQQTMMVDMMYGPLFKELGLSPEETDKFKELLLDQQMKAMDHVGGLFKPAEEKADRAAAMQELTQQQKESEEQLKTFLGEERFAQYKDYTETMGERMVLNQFTQQMAGGPNALTEGQTKQLLDIMKAEKQNGSAAAASSELAAALGQGGLEAMMSEDQMEKLFAQQEDLNRRVLARAATVLTPDQAQSLGAFQTNQLGMQRMGMTMAVKLFGTDKAKEPKPGP